MQNRVPVARKARPALPEFTPVPRVYRHDGWTPARQKAFIEALADTGSVSRSAAMVNMAQANCYTLRRAPGAEEFRRAWEAALDFGVQRLKDIAFERAIEGEMVPVFVAGSLMGYRRKHNNQLLMFCLRHYGQDENGKRTTVNYFSTRASAGGTGEGAAAAEASTTVLRTTSVGDGVNKGEHVDHTAQMINNFAGVDLDAQALAEIEAALCAHTARQREVMTLLDKGGTTAIDLQIDNPDSRFVTVAKAQQPYLGLVEFPLVGEEFIPFTPDEEHWSLAGLEMPAMLDGASIGMPAVLPEACDDIAEVKKPKRKSNSTPRKLDAPSLTPISADTSAGDAGAPPRRASLGHP